MFDGENDRSNDTGSVHSDCSECVRDKFRRSLLNVEGDSPSKKVTEIVSRGSDILTAITDICNSRDKSNRRVLQIAVAQHIEEKVREMYDLLEKLQDMYFAEKLKQANEEQYMRDRDTSRQVISEDSFKQLEDNIVKRVVDSLESKKLYSEVLANPEKGKVKVEKLQGNNIDNLSQQRRFNLLGLSIKTFSVGRTGFGPWLGCSLGGKWFPPMLAICESALMPHAFMGWCFCPNLPCTSTYPPVNIGLTAGK